MDRSRRTRLRVGGVLSLALLAGCGSVVGGAGPAGAETLLPKASTFVVQLKGNGHGHGLSQYGARGAAIAGRTYGQILAFYYPGTTLSVQSSRIFKVRLSGLGTTTTIAARSGTKVSGVSGYLPTSGVRRYRLVANTRSGLTLQRLLSTTGATWTNYRTGLPNRAEFYRYGGVPTRVYLADGTSKDYDGYLRAVRVSASGTAGGVYTVNRVNDDRYTAGVVPREMPASWQRAAVNAQAVAARTYAAYSAAHPSNPEYDICDTSQCQVYGGRALYSSSGALLWSGFDPAANDTAHRILKYGGGPIFAQFSASHGGWSVAGGQSYLVSKADVYDTAASGDPYLLYKQTVSVASVAKYYRLAKVTAIAVTARDGHGTWGGRVTAGYVKGTDSSGRAKTVATTGSGFAAAFGVGTTWLLLPSA
jgi:stage II sporulation protein D